MRTQVSGSGTVKKRLLALGGAAALIPLALMGTAMWLRLRHGGGDALDSVADTLSLKAGDVRRFQWVSQEKLHWQIVGPGPLETPTQTEAREKTRGKCRLGMVEVEGDFLLDSYGTDVSEEVEAAQSKTCTSWINKDFPARCADFDPVAWKASVTPFKKKPLHFCIDRFEYPNQHGAYPWIVATYTEAAAVCKRDHKRLCNEDEWTFACEGEEGTPYPGGYQREAAACVTDRDWREFDPEALGNRDSQRAEGEVDRLWQGEASGSRATCRSSFGVYDLTGNVDEWTSSVRKGGYRSVLKGGYWGPVRSRCRPATRAHNEQFVAYQQGFRCCSALPGDSEREPEPTELGSQEAAGAAETTPDGPDASGGLTSAPQSEFDNAERDEDEALGTKLRGAARGCGL